ncbi:hypothetical protein RGQ29_020467 [Quercus rubra]|uniref:ADP/ATP translocase n=1 Tax=Quercus rubra TaxID=3512 RepID=A0AAN7FDW6_QUERU|nr:hypothetical protein RGQ29_020467 [Quercus rubra]KAK4589896.1 hypothetical protein RGQ29_020467 [Quercus rubra]
MFSSGRFCYSACSGCWSVQTWEFSVIGVISLMTFITLIPSVHCLFTNKEDFLAASVMAVGVVVCQKMATYPLDTVNRRMMMTSGEVVKYQSSIHAFAEIIRNESVKLCMQPQNKNFSCYFDCFWQKNVELFFHKEV